MNIIYFLTFKLFVAVSFSGTLAQDDCSMTAPCSPLKGGESFRQPLEVSSSSGSLYAVFVVDIWNVTIDWLTVQRRLYSSLYSGPTLRIKAGDLVNLNLINNLTEPDFPSTEQNGFAFPNTTNLHTHGLHISSREPQDNVFIRIPPGSNYEYHYEIDDQQPAGTYFYHSHYHRAGFFQVHSGMAGMLVVEDDPSTLSTELNEVSCPNHCENDVRLVLQLFQYAAIDDGDFAAVQKDINDYEGFRLNNFNITNSTETLEEWLQDPENNIQYFLVNGLLQPDMTMELGQTKRFRLLNAGGLHSVAVKIDQNDEGSECEVREIAVDGLYLDAPRVPRTGRSLLLSGGRVDWIVRCSTVGTYQLRSVFMEEDERSLADHPKFEGVLMTIHVTESSSEEKNFPTSLPSLPPFLPDLRSISEKDIEGRVAVEVTATDSLNREDYLENNFRFRMKVDTIQEMIFTNTEYETSHPIHMHVNSFQVISYNHYTGPYAVDDGEGAWGLYSQAGEVCKWQHKTWQNVSFTLPDEPLKHLGHENSQDHLNSIGYVEVGERRDTLLVPPLSNITVRFITSKYTGDVVIHCHLLPDADQGMIMVAQIVGEGESTDANVTSAGAYPWSCIENNPVPQPQCCGVMIFEPSKLVIFCLICVAHFLQSFR